MKNKCVAKGENDRVRAERNRESLFSWIIALPLNTHGTAMCNMTHWHSFRQGQQFAVWKEDKNSFSSGRQWHGTLGSTCCQWTVTEEGIPRAYWFPYRWPGQLTMQLVWLHIRQLPVFRGRAGGVCTLQTHSFSEGPRFEPAAQPHKEEAFGAPFPQQSTAICNTSQLPH